jgi:hypothetical protein
VVGSEEGTMHYEPVSEPRQWTIGVYEGTWGLPECWLVEPGTPDHPKGGEKVRVREDVVTEEDVTAVSCFLAEVGHDEECLHYVDQARELLSLVLGSGKEDKDG